LRCIAGQWILTLADLMEGELELGGVVRPLADLRASSRATRDPEIPDCSSVTLETASRALVHWGGVSFAIRFVPNATPIPRERTKNLDFPFLNALLMTSLLHVAVVTVLLLYPYDLQAIQGDRGIDAAIELTTRPAPVQLRTTPPRAPPRPSQLMPTVPEPVAPTRRPIRAHGNGLSREAQLARIRARIKTLFGRDDQGAGIMQGQSPMNLADTLVNVIGTRGTSGVQDGPMGNGARGDGPVTGGPGGTSRDIGAIGPAGGLGRCTRGPCLGPDMRKRSDRGPPLELRPPRFGEALPKDVIRKVIDENKGQIRYCYERELQKNAELEGMVRVKFVIGATGRVVVAIITDSTLNNPAAEDCMRQKILTWVFPPPAGGGRVDVNYPFIFHSVDK
jgi:TonB family protein